MVWFKVDDGFWSHPKTLELSSDAIALWVRGGAYCAGQLTNGVVSKGALRMLGGDRDAAVELVLCGLWEQSGDGYVFHDWAEYQPTREQVLAERAAATERKRKSREEYRKRSRGESRRDSYGTDAVIPRSPTRPDPTRPDPLTSSFHSEVREGADAARSPFCPKHPEGTDGPCRPCGNARMAFELATAAEKNKPTLIPVRAPECDQHPGYPLPCDKCARIAEEVA